MFETDMAARSSATVRHTHTHRPRFSLLPLFTPFYSWK